MLAALAPFTQSLRLGVLVCGNTYRNPAFLLKQAVTVDHISGGRVDFGVGAGWTEREHEAYGWEYPSARERVDRFAEALEIWDRVGGGDSFASGLIYGLLSGKGPQYAVECGAAHGALAMTTPGDTSMATLGEVERVMKGGTARVSR